MSSTQEYNSNSADTPMEDDVFGGEEEKEPFSVSKYQLQYRKRIISVHEDMAAIEKFQNMKNTTVDAFNYTFFTAETMLSFYLCGRFPQYYYIIYTIKALLFSPLRYYYLHREGRHFFLVDFCNFVNYLLLFYLWSPWVPKGMFSVLFILGHGVPLFSIYMDSNANSLVPHSVEKMTLLFLHTSPPIVTSSLRWYSTPEQGFELCADPTEPGVNGCNHVHWYSIALNVVPYHIAWILFYTLIVFVLFEKHIKTNNYMTTFNVISKETTKYSIIDTVINIFGLNNFGQKYPKIVYFIVQTIITAITTALGYYSYHSFVYNNIYFMFFVIIACYRGATFYIRVVGKSYYNQENKKK